MAEIVGQPPSNGHTPLLGGLLKDNGVEFTGFGDQQQPMPQFPPGISARLFLITIKGLKVGPSGFRAAAANESTNQSGTKLVPFTPAFGNPNDNGFKFRPGPEDGTWVAEMQIDIDVSGLWLYFQMQNSHDDIAPNWFPRWTLDIIDIAHAE